MSSMRFLTSFLLDSQTTTQSGSTWNELTLGCWAAVLIHSSRAEPASSLSGLPSILLASDVSPPRQSQVLFCVFSYVLNDSLLLMSTSPPTLPVTPLYSALTLT